MVTEGQPLVRLEFLLISEELELLILPFLRKLERRSGPFRQIEKSFLIFGHGLSMPISQSIEKENKSNFFYHLGKNIAILGF